MAIADTKKYGASFLVPADQMTLTDQKQYKQDAINLAVARMLALRIVTDQGGIMVRQIRAFADLGVGTINEDEWGIALPAAGVNAGVINTGVRPANQIVVFFGLDDFDNAPQATLTTFGTAAVGGTTKQMVDLQVARGWLNSAGFLAEAVVYDPLEIIFVTMESDAIHAVEYIAFLGYILEPRGTVVS